MMTTGLISIDLPLPTFQSSQGLINCLKHKMWLSFMTDQYAIVQSPHWCSFRINYLQVQCTVILQT